MRTSSGTQFYAFKLNLDLELLDEAFSTEAKAKRGVNENGDVGSEMLLLYLRCFGNLQNNSLQRTPHKLPPFPARMNCAYKIGQYCPI